MPKRQVFYSFHYANDVMRAQQIRNIGTLEGNAPVSPNTWEEVKAKGEDAVKKWIDDTMALRSCVVVLIGEKTSTRPLVKYEIKKAWTSRKGLFGIYIHNLKDPKTGTSLRGSNPFDGTNFKQGEKQVQIATYDPSSIDTYGDIAKNIEFWIEKAIEQQK